MMEEGKTDKTIIPGYDRRFLSDTAAKWMAEYARHTGLRCRIAVCPRVRRGHEPLLRIFAEESNAETAKDHIQAFRYLLSLE